MLQGIDFTAKGTGIRTGTSAAVRYGTGLDPLCRPNTANTDNVTSTPASAAMPVFGPSGENAVIGSCFGQAFTVSIENKG